MSRFTRIAGVAIFGAALCVDIAMAGSTSGQFNVTSSVLANCTISASDLAFGNYTAGVATPVTANTTLAVTCTNALPYTISMNGGTTTGAPAARAMSDGASHLLTYNLYTTSAYATVFGDGSGTTATQAGTGTGAGQSITVYGSIPGSQFVNAGNYTDRITVTLAY